MYNISLKDELLSETRRSFDSEAIALLTALMAFTAQTAGAATAAMI